VQLFSWPDVAAKCQQGSRLEIRSFGPERLLSAKADTYEKPPKVRVADQADFRDYPISDGFRPTADLGGLSSERPVMGAVLPTSASKLG